MKQTLARLALTLPVVWLVVSLVFLLIHLVPGDPIAMMLGEGATPADIGALRHQYQLDLPLGTQYLHYWSGVVRGDFGNSIRMKDTVGHLIAQRYPYTMALTLTALVLALVLASWPRCDEAAQPINCFRSSRSSASRCRASRLVPC